MPNFIENKKFQGFYDVPGYPQQLAISKLGLVVDVQTGKELEQKQYGGYRCINYNRKTIGIHRLLGLTFLEKPNNIPVNKLIINHKNGNKLDNSLDNLEWTDHRGNLLHAFRTGLRKDSLEVWVKDIATEDIYTFRSLQECARFFNTNPSKIHDYLKPDKYGKIVFNKYLIVRKGQLFPKVDSTALEKKAAKTYWCDFVVKDMDTGGYYIFNTVTYAAEYFQLKPSTVAMALYTAMLKGNTHIKFGKYEMCYLSTLLAAKTDLSTATRLSKVNRDIPYFRRKPARIKVTELDTGISYEKESLTELAKDLKVKDDTLRKHILANNGVFRGYLKIEYLKESKVCPTTQ